MKKIYDDQKRLFLSGITKSYEFRKEQLMILKTMLLENIAEIEVALYLDLNKSKIESYMCEIGILLEEIRFALKNLRKWMKPKREKTPITLFPAKSKILMEPYGNTVIISPWNYPIMLSLGPVISAIAAGNTCVIKPSELSENSSNLLEKLISKYFPNRLIVVRTGDKEITTQILSYPYDYIFYTGGARVGKIVMEKASHFLTPVTLELGGKSPCIITQTAHIEVAAKKIIFGKLLNAGQTCVAPDYVLIHYTLKEQFISYCIKMIEEFVGKNAVSLDDYPKIISSKHHERLMNLIFKSKVIYQQEHSENKISPVLIEASFENEIMKEEIFGPLLPIITFNELSDTLEMLNKWDSPLALYIFSNKKNEIDLIERTLRYGGGCVNDVIMHLANYHLPFGGIGKSGMGNSHGFFGFETFSHRKAILYKSKKMDLNVKYRPYNVKKEQLIKRIMK